jgi:multiple sugar transport system permease protein
MTIAKALRSLLALAALLVIVWSFYDVGMRTWRGAGARRAVTLTVLHWGTPSEVEIMQSLVDRFEHEHPDIRIVRIHAGDYESKLKTMFAAGTPPDVFYLGYENLPEMAGMKLLTDLTPYIEKEKASGRGAWLDDFYPILMDAFRFDGEKTGKGPLYGLPKDFTTSLMYVNVDLFKEAGIPIPYEGWTWDEYEQDMKKIASLSHTKGRGEVYGGVLNTWPAVLRNILWCYGGDFFGESFRDVRLDDPGSIAAMEMIQRTRFIDHSVFNATGLSKDGGQEFYTGNVGCIGPQGRWMTPRYRSITNFQWDVVPLPHQKRKVSMIFTVSWAMSASTRHPKESFELMKFLSGPEGQVMSAKLGLAIPSLQSIAHSQAFLDPDQKPKHTPIFLKEIAHSELAQNPRIRGFDDILNREVAEAIQFNRTTPMRAARAVENSWLAEINSPLQSKEYPPMRWDLIGGGTAALILAATALFWWRARRERIGPLDRRQERAGWMFIMPWILGFLVLTLGPMVLSLLLALTKWTALTPFTDARYVGFDNFAHMARYDEDFLQSLKVTFYYVLLAVPLGQIAALAVAVLMNNKVRGIGLFRTIYFVPSVVSGVALATLWLWIFNKDYGLLNTILWPVARWLGTTPPDWFGMDANLWAIPGFVLMGLWGVGAGMVIYLAGLKGVPTSLYEAATIDGAGAWRRFWNVTLPMLSPLIFYNLVMGIIGSFQIFTQAKVMTNGGPGNATLFYVLNLYRQAFELHKMGYASALAWVLFVIVLVLTLLVFRGSKNLVYYEGLKA